MRKTENHSPSGLVFPADGSPEEEISVIKEHLQNAGFSKADSDWLVDVFKHPDCFGDPNDTAVFKEDFTVDFEQFFPMIAEEITEAVQIEKDSQTNLALLFSMMLDFGPRYNTVFSPNVPLKEANGSLDIPQWVSEFQRHAKFCAKSLDWQILNKMTKFDELLPFLFPSGVPLNHIVDLGLLNPVRRGKSSNDFNDPKQLEFWLIRRFKNNKERCDIVRLDALLHDFSNFPDDILGEKVFGLCNAIFYTMNSGSRFLNPVGNGWKVVAHELIPFFELLDMKRPEVNQERSPLLKAWWHLSKLIYSWSMGGLESELTEDLKNRLVESASRHIGILRKLLRDTPEVFEGEDFPEVSVSDFYDKAFYVLLCFAPPWKCIKPLLLAFSEMTKQAVASHLGFWSESEIEPPPYPYSEIPLWIGVSMYPQNLQKELEQDPHLRELREEFAKFCLERLRTKTKDKNTHYTNEDFVEPRPAWRQCYVQALKALRVNPGGRGHRTLFWLLDNDPDEQVRELSKKAHKQVRHLDRNKPNLDDGASPRRPLFEAFWWLRQSHLLTLGITIDHSGAMRTRRKELHRTQEKDDRFNPKG